MDKTGQNIIFSYARYKCGCHFLIFAWKANYRDWIYEDNLQRSLANDFLNMKCNNFSHLHVQLWGRNDAKISSWNKRKWKHQTTEDQNSSLSLNRQIQCNRWHYSYQYFIRDAIIWARGLYIYKVDLIINYNNSLYYERSWII